VIAHVFCERFVQIHLLIDVAFAHMLQKRFDGNGTTYVV
jgi:hypothetical protein